MPVGSVTGLSYRRGRNIPRVVDYQYPGMGVVDTARYLAGQALRPVQYMTPGVGDWMAHQDAVEKYGMAGQAWDEGRVLDAAMHGAGGLVDDLTTVPVLGDAAMLAKGLGAGIGKMAPAFAAMTAYHGTPHRFPPTKKNPLGEFELSKIGTGEGAQAYGHGIYLAENPEVAGSYTMAGQGGRDFNAVEYAGKEYGADTDLGRLLAETSREGRRAVTDKLERQIEENISYAPDRAELLKSYVGFIKKVDPDNVIIKGGSLYEVDLPDDQIAKMLDWDAPMNEQPESVRKAIAGRYGDKTLAKLDKVKWTGRQFYQDFFDPADIADQEEISALLNSIGIPGIKYYDAGSRTAGSGTRNFVLFDPDIAKIIGRK